MLIKKLSSDAVIPTRHHEFDAGFDLYSIEGVTLKPGQITKIKTGIALGIPPGFVGLIWDRSGNGSKGIKVFGGVIDSGYRGEIIVCLGLMNTFEREWVNLLKGTKIAQLLIQKVELVELTEVDKLPDSSRGERGFDGNAPTIK